MNSLLTISTMIFPLITFPYVSRVLQPDGIGKVTLATAILTYFVTFAQLGIPTYGVRVCAQVRDDRAKLTRTAHELLLINLVVSAFAYIALAIAIITVPRLREERMLYIVMSSMILLTAIGMEWMYRAMEEYTFITVRSLIFKLISIAGMFLLVHQKEDYVIYGFLTLVASYVSYIWNFIHARKHIDLRWVGRYQFRRHIRPITIFFVVSCATIIYTNLDTVMLGFMTNDAEVGYYNTAVKVKNILIGVVASLGTVLLPRVSYYVETKQMDAFWQVCGKAVNFVLLLATPLMVYFMIFAQQSVLLLSGDAYLPAVVPMQIIMPTILFIGLTNILGIQIMVPLGKEKMVMYSVIAGALVDLILNAILIPTMSSAGAAIGTLVAELVVLGVQYFALRNESIADAFRKVRWMKIFLSLIAGALASGWVCWMNWSSFVSLVVSACLFFGVYGSMLLLTKEDLVFELVFKLVKKLKRG